MQLLKKILLALLAILVLIVIIYLLGPKISFGSISHQKAHVSSDLQKLQQEITLKESQISAIKPGNAAQIVWADSTQQKTPYSVVYLHGFSASHEEGAPIHTDFAKRYGMNLYLSRLYDHGRQDSNTFKNLTPQQLYDSANEAITIGKQLGEKVIIMSCSTGSTLDIICSKYHDEIAAHFMYSPNIKIADPSASLVTGPWGAQLIDIVMGGDYNRIQYKEEAKLYWCEVYHTDGILALQFMIDQYMTDEAFKTIDEPVFLGCYYKDEEHQDNVVSVAAMYDFYDAIATPAHQKELVAFPNAGRHVICSHVFSEDLESVRKETYEFAESVLGLVPVQ